MTYRTNAANAEPPRQLLLCVPCGNESKTVSQCKTKRGTVGLINYDADTGFLEKHMTSVDTEPLRT